MLRSLCLFVCGVAIAAGVIVGWLDTRADRGSSVKPGAGSEESPLARALRVGSPGKEADSSRSQGARPDAQSAKEAPSGTASAVDLPSVLSQVRRLLDEKEFARAASVGADALEKASGAPPSALRDLSRLTSRARVLDRIVRSLPEPKELEGLSEVHLANGQTLVASKVDREGDRTVVHIMKGGTFVPKKGDVVEIRPLDVKAFREAEWKALKPRLDAVSHPLDLFLDGVQRCWELGLEDRSLEILGRILTMDSPQTDQVPLLFVPDADERVLHDWRVAAGREEPTAPTGPPTLAEAGPPGPLPAGQVPGGEGGAGPGETRPGIPSGGETRPPAPAGPSPDPAELVKAAQFVAEAQVLYRGSVGREGKEDDLRKARDRLDSALEVIESQPQDDETVKRLRRQVAQLLYDVAKASPF